MSKPRFSGLGRVMRSQADVPGAEALVPDEEMPADEMPDGDPDAPDEDDEECEAGTGRKKKDTNMTDTTKKPGAEASATETGNPQANATSETSAASENGDPVANARAEERKRIADVFASEHVKGREMAAAELLANSDMKADAIVAMLPKLTPAADADEGKQMLESMRTGASPDLGNGDAVAEEPNHGWAKIHEEIRQRRQA